MVSAVGCTALTEAALADLLGVHRDTVYRWRKRGTGPDYIKAGRVIRYDRADVDRWIEDRKRTSTSEGE